MVSCAVPGCGSSKRNNPQNYSFHQFPINQEIREKWLRMINRQNWNPHKYSTICSKHFHEHCYSPTMGGKRRKLRSGSVPTVCMPVELKVPRKPTMYQYRDIEPVPSTSANTESISSSELTPRKKKMLRTITTLKKRIIDKGKKLKNIRAQKKRKEFKIIQLNQVIKDLQARPSLRNDLTTVIESCPNDLLSHLVERVNNDQKNVIKSRAKYGLELRKFAITLHFYSPQAYNFIRKKFSLCLPHPRTLRGWYQNINCEPGITQEAINAIKQFRAEKPDLIISLTMDEMGIREFTEWDGCRHYGFVDVGNNLSGDKIEVAKEVLVFMAVAVNSYWKLPIAFFFGRGFTAVQKASLLKLCIDALIVTEAIVMSVTFDGIPSNINMVRILGANLDYEPYKPFFTYKNKKIYTILDACHLLKLIRNAFADFKTFHHNDEIISYNYITYLNNLQEKIELNLSNKLTHKHVNYFKNKMKVKLAAQLLSNSVATSIEYCEESAQIPEFNGAKATVNFIRLVNNTFDIFNSRNLLNPGYKKPINSHNVNMIFKELDKFTEYMQNLTLESNRKIITSARKLGFLGFICNIQSLKMLYNDYINSNLLKFFPLYKLSQDHLETFFSCIRARGGFNNNPSARSFMSAYKRLLCHAEVQISDNTNCLPLENITILGLSDLSTMQRLNIGANEKTEGSLDEDIMECSVSSVHEVNDFLISLPCENTQEKEIIKIVVQYIGGYIVKVLQNKLKCGDCIAVLHAPDRDVKSLIFYKDKGGLIYPSKDVIDVCLFCEAIFRENIRFKNLNKNKLQLIVTRTIYNFMHKFSTLNDHCFPSLNDHIYNQDPINNHKYLLVKLIIEKYFNIRIKYEHKLRNVNKDSIRQFYNKMIIFKGV